MLPLFDEYSATDEVIKGTFDSAESERRALFDDGYNEPRGAGIKEL